MGFQFVLQNSILHYDIPGGIMRVHSTLIFHLVLWNFNLYFSFPFYATTLQSILFCVMTIHSVLRVSILYYEILLFIISFYIPVRAGRYEENLISRYFWAIS